MADVENQIEKSPEVLIEEVKAITDEFDNTLKLEEAKKLPKWLTCLFEWAASLRKSRQNGQTLPSSA